MGFFSELMGNASEIEGTEAAELNLFALDQCGRDCINGGVQNPLGILFCQTGMLGGNGDQFGFVHVGDSSFLTRKSDLD